MGGGQITEVGGGKLLMEGGGVTNLPMGATTEGRDLLMGGGGEGHFHGASGQLSVYTFRLSVYKGTVIFGGGEGGVKLTDGCELFNIRNPLVVDEVVVLLGVRQGTLRLPAPLTSIPFTRKSSTLQFQKVR